jgi:6-phosphogluconolactonase
MVDTDTLTRWEPCTTMTRFLYVGTYTHTPEKTHRNEGIFSYVVQPTTGKLILSQAMYGGKNPGFLAFSPDRKFLYTVNELDEGGVSAFAVDGKTGALTFLNDRSTRGMHPCYLSLDPNGKFVMVANYSSANLNIFPVREDGSLAEESDFVQFTGSGPNKARQTEAHAHSIAFDPNGKFVLAADLGTDRLMIYRLDTQTGKLIANNPASGSVQPGAGPRHFTFSRDGKFLYVANEVDNSVTACTWDSEKGVINAFQALSTLPAGFTGESTVADIHFGLDGSYLYVSNRGDQSLATYAVNAKDGTMRLVGHTSVGGNWPRNFAVDPSGNYIYVANQYSNDVVTFKINHATGMPEPTGQVIQVPIPVCLKFLDL